MSEDEKKRRILHIDSISITRSGGDNGSTPPEKRGPGDLECGPPDKAETPNTLADLFKAMDYSHSKPGQVFDDIRAMNLHLPPAHRHVFPGAVLDYSKLSAEMLGRTWQDIEMERIKGLIRDNPDMANDELYMLVMGLSSGPALYQTTKCPKCNQGDSEKD